MDRAVSRLTGSLWVMGFPLLNPQSLALLNRSSYLTVSEFLFAPTALDLTSLVPAGTNISQAQAALDIVNRASSWIDTYVFPDLTGGTLGASIDTDTGSFPVDSDGYVRAVCRFKPILEVLSFAYGSTPLRTQALDPTAVGNIEPGPSSRVLYVPVNGSYTGAVFGGAPSGRGGRVYCQWQYVDGYPHSTLGASVAVGGTSLTVATTLGCQPGTVLTVYDQWRTETVTVVAVVSSTVLTVSPFQQAHAVPAEPDAVSVSALPAVVKQAAILVASAMVKERGDNSMVLPTADGMAFVGSKESGSVDDLSAAREMLCPFRIVAGRA